MPDALRSFEFKLTAKVRSVTQQRDLKLQADASVVVNQLDASSEVADVYLSKTAQGYLVHVLGKSGEPRAGVEVGLSLGHLEFRDRVDVRLQTDAAGRIELGELVDIGTVVASLGTGRSRTWNLRRPDFEVASELHAVAGRRAGPPAPAGGQAGRGRLAVRAARLAVRCVIWSGALTLRDDALTVAGLEPGDYQLGYELEDWSTRIACGPAVGARGWAIWSTSSARAQPGRRACGFGPWSSTTSSCRSISGGFGRDTRVHVFGRRMLPSADAHVALDHRRRTSAPFQRAAARVRSNYLSGRDIGDEYRYILDRKRAEPLPGNMLERPGLLLNPWALRTTSTGVAQAASGGAYASMADEADEY